MLEGDIYTCIMNSSLRRSSSKKAETLQFVVELHHAKTRKRMPNPFNHLERYLILAEIFPAFHVKVGANIHHKNSKRSSNTAELKTHIFSYWEGISHLLNQMVPRSK